MSKEIWKLLELLNEYRKEKGERNLNEFEVSQTLDSLNYLRLFIKWLVENEKIDYEKIEKQTKCKNIVGWKEFLDFDIERDFNPYEEVLMWLAISDNPIDFLCEILK